jgi:uncharacterized protein (DUF1330 family)
MPGYVFMHADVTDPDVYEEFKSLASAAIADHGGRYLVRGGAMQPLEGEWRSRAVLLEFPTYAAALAFYHSDAYQQARQVRLGSSTASILAMEGISDA